MERARGARSTGRARWRRERLTRVAAALAILIGTAGTDSCCDDEPTTPTETTEAPGLTGAAQAQGFLDTEHFDGSWKPRESDADWGGEAIYRGRVVFLHLERVEVEKVLPAALQLAAKKSPTEPELHPVVVLFGHQTETKLVYPFWTPEVGDDYRELILLVPFVQKSGHQRWHNYVVRMYLDDEWAIKLGNDYYGLQKLDADFEETPTRFSVIREWIERFEFQSTSNGPWITDAEAEANLANYPAMKEITAMPVIGTPTWADFICSYFEWHFAGTQVRSIEGTSEFLQPFNAGMDSWVDLGAIPSVTDGAWQLEKFRWRIAFPPFPCEF